MTRINRRAFMGGVGLAGLAGVLAACGESAPPSTGGGAAVDGGATGGSGGTLRWWHHFGGLQDLHEEWAATYGPELGVDIEITYNEPSKAIEALQLANQSNQLPDIYTPLIGLPLPALVEAGWIHEITLSQEAMSRLPEGSFVEGLTMLDGKVYGLPTFSSKQYVGLVWYNARIAEQVGFEPPKSYDDLLAALKAVADDGTYAPMTMALGAVGRMREQIDDMAQAAGDRKSVV